jgi:hypothetical protein
MLSGFPAHRARARGAVSLAAAALVTTSCMIGSAAAGTGYGPPLPLGTAATSNGTLGPTALLGPETRAQIIARAQDWIAQGVMYSDTQNPDGTGDWNFWSDPATGGPYRQDCSGYVSMAWGLGSSQASYTIDASPYSTITDSNITGDTNLNPGDALDYHAGHIVLFDHWTDAAGDFAYDAEHTQGRVTNQSDDNIYSSSLEGYPMSDFEALQRNKLSAGSPGSGGVSPTEPGLSQDASGKLVAVARRTDGATWPDYRTEPAAGPYSGRLSLGGTLARTEN